MALGEVESEKSSLHMFYEKIQTALSKEMRLAGELFSDCAFLLRLDSIM